MAGVFDLYDLVGYWQQLGVYDVILPFLLVFTITFALLQKLKLFGEKSKKVDVVLALVFGFLFLQNPYLISLTQRFLPNISFFMIIFLMLLLLIGIWKGDAYKGISGAAVTLAFFGSLAAVLISLTSDLFMFGPTGGLLDFYYSIDPSTRALLWFVLIVVGLIALVTYGDGDKSPRETYADRLAEGFFGSRKDK